MIKRIRYAGRCCLAYADVGDAQGYPILIQHGMIASIADYPLFQRLIAAGARLISIARPGYGESSAYELRDMAEWGEVVAALVGALALEAFDVLGMSSGAPYSYAIGRYLPAKTRRIWVFSGAPALYDARVARLWPYAIKREGEMAEFQRLAREVFFPNPSPEELARADVRDSMRNDCFGVAQDLRLRGRDWGFRLEDVPCAVYMEHARDDDQIPLATAEITASLLPRCTLHVRESGGHFSAALLDAFIARAMAPTLAHHDSDVYQEDAP